MKLRIRSDSLRFRLTKSEVTSLHEQGWWQDAVTLGSEGYARLAYRIEVGTSQDVRFGQAPVATLTAVVPRSALNPWATESAEIGIYFETPWGTKVAIEKDFRCLDEKRDEDESDNFDNPNADTSMHGECCVS